MLIESQIDGLTIGGCIRKRKRKMNNEICKAGQGGFFIMAQRLIFSRCTLDRPCGFEVRS
jgi:hypothetical protein